MGIRTCTFVAFIILFSSAALAQTEKGDIVFPQKSAGAVFFSHGYHTRVRGVKCSACHFNTFSASVGSFQIKKEKLTKRDFCGHCHNGLKGFDQTADKNCIRCHKE